MSEPKREQELRALVAEAQATFDEATRVYEAGGTAEKAEGASEVAAQARRELTAAVAAALLEGEFGGAAHKARLAEKFSITAAELAADMHVDARKRAGEGDLLDTLVKGETTVEATRLRKECPSIAALEKVRNTASKGWERAYDADSRAKVPVQHARSRQYQVDEKLKEYLTARAAREDAKKRKAAAKAGAPTAMALERGREIRRTLVAAIKAVVPPRRKHRW